MLSLTTFTHGSHFNIMSPLADLDLRQFLTGDYHDYLERQTRFTPYDLLMEAACLVGALDFLHFRLRLTDKKIACAHLDFKPENVLVIWNPNVHVRSVGKSQIVGTFSSIISLLPRHAWQFVNPIKRSELTLFS